MSVNGQDLVYGEKIKFRPSIQLSKHCAYETVAQGFNCVGAKATTLAEVGPAVKKLVESGRPGLLNMIVSVKPTTPATLSMVSMTDDKDVIVVSQSRRWTGCRGYLVAVQNSPCFPCAVGDVGKIC